MMIPEDQVVSAIKSTNGKFFSVTFTKRTTGERRTMLARTGVHKHLKGGQSAYVPSERHLHFVFDIKKGAYRSVPTDAVTSFQCGSLLLDGRPQNNELAD